MRVRARSLDRRRPTRRTCETVRSGTIEKTGYRLPLDAGRFGASLAEPSDGPVRQNIGQRSRVNGSDPPSLVPLSPASEVRSLEFVCDAAPFLACQPGPANVYSVEILD